MMRMFFILQTGHICVIDCDIRINIPELRTGGTRILTNKVEFQLE